MQITINSVLDKIKKISYYLFLIRNRDGLYRAKRSDIILNCGDADRHIDLNGKAYSPLLDSVGNEFELSRTAFLRQVDN